MLVDHLQKHDMAYGGFKDLTRRTAPDKILRDKAFIIAKNAKYDEYQRSLASMVYNVFDKKASGCAVKNKNMSNHRPLDLATRELSGELHKPIIRKSEKRKVYSPFIDNI